ncbi:hypothetical protein [Nocardia cyriacigeorgica]|uniref:hypothetical protein n=1 Tax=Nocardia cyriacigeorgica TaxID=135487 RepID=UPI001895C530|nr:hypothetical protein [Nocardia cyriacigeorgica]MBF6439325.1 hypothetical protein [Nocardia cyriacigeorgica]MBF6455585.1 hypothetical protein [Nocardia cyriacigeorgica]MBF6479536.1 hypothetical protein [Nocardia cyriacigeorgica]MBF6553673.1 hypothetical protein [Nocardia cyriacigeorgica]
MAIGERLGQAALDGTPIYGEPFETADGATIITVAHRYGRFGTGVRPVGVFTIRDGEAVWVRPDGRCRRTMHRRVPSHGARSKTSPQAGSSQAAAQT